VPDDERSRSSRRRSGFRAGLTAKHSEVEIWESEGFCVGGELEEGGSRDGWGATGVVVDVELGVEV
jgi:hypothetical protein